MFLAQPEARPVRLRAEEVGRAAEPQDARLVDDDRLRALAAACSSSFTSRRSSSAPSTSGRRGGRDLYRLEMENFANPLMVGVLRAQHGRRRLASVARRLERLPVARRSTIRAGRRASSPPARCSPSLIAGGFIVIALWAHFAGRRGHEAGREEFRPARSPRSGTGTSSR